MFILFQWLYLVFTLIISTSNVVDADNAMVKTIADTLVKILANDELAMQSDRFKQLKDKIGTIFGYVVDHDKNAKLLLNETIDITLNNTRFYEALKDKQVHRDYLNQNERKNLYLKLKESMTRDDIINVLSERAADISVPVRRAMASSGTIDDINTIVDKMLAQPPTDDHTFDNNNTSSEYWDPKKELEDTRDYLEEKESGRRVFRGKRTSIRNYPFMASVKLQGRFWCGAVIYWHDLVLTTAACLQIMHNNRFFRENPRVLQVRVGSNHSRIGGEVIDALEVYFHPGYNPRTLENNIAVIRLRRFVFFNYHKVPKAIRLGDYMHTPSPTSTILILGWGVKKSSQKMSYEPVFLQVKILPVYPNVFCKEVYGDKFISASMFCAGTMTTGEGACDHDAGGPAVIDGSLVGLISFGPAVCGMPNMPTVLTLVTPYKEWLESINSSMPSYYRTNRKTTTTTAAPVTMARYRPRFKQTLVSLINPLHSSEEITKPPTTTPQPTTSPTVTTASTTITDTTTTATSPSGLRKKKKKQKQKNRNKPQSKSVNPLSIPIDMN